MLDLIVIAVTFLFIGALMYYLPVMKGADAFFGIPVSDEFYRGPTARRWLATYKLITVLLIAGALAFLFVGLQFDLLTPGTVMLAVLVACLGPMVPLVILWRQVKPYEVRPELTVEAAEKAGGIIEERPADRWRYVAPWLEVLLVAALLLLTGLTLWRYPELPARVPVHWNAAGHADGWQAKSPFLFAALLLMVAFFHVMFVTLLVGMARIPVRLPAQRADEFRVARESYMRMWVYVLNGLRVVLVVMFGGIIWASLFGIEQQAQGSAPPGMALVWASTAVLLVGLGWAIWRSLRLRAQMREIGGPGLLESAAPTEGWIGGMVYYNRNDPALWVEKRIGIGWTFNFAHPSAWAMMVLLLVVPLAIAAVAMIGAKG